MYRNWHKQCTLPLSPQIASPLPPSTMHTSRSLAAFTSLLEIQGAEAAIHHLNAGVAHRFTAVYRLDGGMLRNVLLCDKLGEICPEFLAEVPLATSFCQFVLGDGVFQTTNSASDPPPGRPPLPGCRGLLPRRARAGQRWRTVGHLVPLRCAGVDHLRCRV